MSLAENQLHPVYEFRPLPGAIGGYGDLMRWKDGEWIPDDGEYGLAFSQGNTCLSVSLPYQKNIICQWYSKHWSGHEPKHPGGNAWHYMLRTGETAWGGNWGRDKHPNTVAGDKGISALSAKHRCANGRHVEFNLRDKHIRAGLVRNAETKEVLHFPASPKCMYCADNAQALIAELEHIRNP